MFTGESQLPVLGVGVSLSFGMKPDPRTLARAPGGPSFIEYAGAVRHEDVAPHVDGVDLPLLFHPSCLNLCGPWSNPTDWLQAAAEHAERVRSAWVAQDVAVCFTDEPGYSTQLGYFLPPILSQRGLDEAVERVLEVRRVVKRPLLLEPAPVSYRTGPMPVWAWLQQLAERTDCGLLLDAGHVLSHQLSLGREPTDMRELDMERVIEVHVAGGVLEDGLYQDAHDLPILPEVWSLFEHIVSVTPRLRAVCLECEGGASHTVLPLLRHVRERAWLVAANEALRARIRVELG